MKELLEKKKIRIDGRYLDEKRPLDIKVNYLQTAHIGALFKRVLTEVLSVTTLGKISEKKNFLQVFSLKKAIIS